MGRIWGQAVIPLMVGCGVMILGCTGLQMPVSDSADAVDDVEDEDEEENEEGIPDDVDVEKSGRWVPKKGDYSFVLELESGGDTRTAHVHVPRGAARKLPVVFMFHGGKGGNDGERMINFWEHTKSEEIVTVFPNGLEGGKRAWAGPTDLRDVEFVDDLIERLDEVVGIDSKRLYAAGFSNGSGFTWMLQCERGKTFAGFGHVSQSMAKGLKKKCKPKGHRPFVWFHGDADEKSKWDGGGETLGVDETIEFMLAANDCPNTPSRVDTMKDVDPDDGTKLVHHQYNNCKNLAALELYKVKGGGHAWPTTKGRSKKTEGRSRDIDASETMLAFWKEHAGL